MEEHLTPRYRQLTGPEGIRHQFFCDVSGALVCTTSAVPGDEPLGAWNREAKRRFSQCHRCGSWVSDPMYNADTHECVRCSPWEEQPAFCPHCGERAGETGGFCHRCGSRMKERAEFEARTPEHYGFGTGVMKQIKVCADCGASQPSGRYTCGQCGALLPMQTLFQRYQKMHRQCAVCDAVLSPGMKYCPHCGTELDKEQGGTNP